MDGLEIEEFKKKPMNGSTSSTAVYHLLHSMIKVRSISLILAGPADGDDAGDMIGGAQVDLVV